jgi:hypothetical protein
MLPISTGFTIGRSQDLTPIGPTVYARHVGPTRTPTQEALCTVRTSQTL